MAVVGAGGVGGYFGGRLAAAGAHVSFVARGAHLDALRSRGLTIRSFKGDLHLPHVHATDAWSGVQSIRLQINGGSLFSPHIEYIMTKGFDAETGTAVTGKTKP